jgi:NADH-ubiquinone oxidoreductase chain 5
MHVVNHAFFKALLFLGAGQIIHSVADQQDVRKLGGLIQFLPFTYSVMLIGTIALLGLPWLSGFYSKDLIIELAYSRYSFSGTYAYLLGSCTAGLTAFYSFRLISLVFLTFPNAPKSTYLNVPEANLAVIFPLFSLAIFSIFFGFIFSDLFVGIGTDFFGNSLFIHPNNTSLIEAEFSLPIILKLLPGLLSIIGAGLALFLYHKTPNLINELLENNKILQQLYAFLNGKYFFDVIYNYFIIEKGFDRAYNISKVLDRGVIEALGPYGISKVLNQTGNNIAKLDTGIITTYSLYITLGLLTLLFIIFSPVLY